MLSLVAAATLRPLLVSLGLLVPLSRLINPSEFLPRFEEATDRRRGRGPRCPFDRRDGVENGSPEGVEKMNKRATRIGPGGIRPRKADELLDLAEGNAEIDDRSRRVHGAPPSSEPRSQAAGTAKMWPSTSISLSNHLRRPRTFALKVVGAIFNARATSANVMFAATTAMRRRCPETVFSLFMATACGAIF
jgi:hypothetical protein